MKKTIITKVNDSQVEKGTPVINISLSFYNDYRTYKRHEMVAQLDLVTQILETKSKYKNEKKDTERLIYLAFRPNADINDYCTEVLKYLCSYTNIEDCLKKYPQTDLFCVLHINIDDFKWSECRVLEWNESFYGNSFKLVGKLKNGISLNLPSKFDFLSEEQYKCLIELVVLNRSSSEGVIKLTYSQLWEIWEQYLDEGNEYSKCWIDFFLERLSFCGFIDFKVQLESKDGKTECYYIISICDLDIYKEVVKL